MSSHTYTKLTLAFGALIVIFGGCFASFRDPLSGGVMILGGCVLMASVSHGATSEEPDGAVMEEPTKLLDPSMFPPRPPQ